MAFFDKIGNLAKNIGDKTNEAIETNKLNAKINTEKTAIANEMKKLGEYYYRKHEQGEPLDEGALEFCAVIDEHNRAIQEAQEEIARIKKETEEEKLRREKELEEAEKARQESKIKQAATPTSESVSCPACGAVNAKEMKFCKACGANMEEPAAAQEVCPACGAKNGVDAKFCKECGARMPQAHICKACGEKLSEDAKFCGTCGAKIEQ